MADRSSTVCLARLLVPHGYRLGGGTIEKDSGPCNTATAGVFLITAIQLCRSFRKVSSRPARRLCRRQRQARRVLEEKDGALSQIHACPTRPRSDGLKTGRRILRAPADEALSNIHPTRRRVNPSNRCARTASQHASIAKMHHGRASHGPIEPRSASALRPNTGSEHKEPAQACVLPDSNRRDEAIIARVFSTSYAAGLRVCAVATSGQQAIEAAGRHRPTLPDDVVLSVGMDGTRPPSDRQTLSDLRRFCRPCGRTHAATCQNIKPLGYIVSRAPSANSAS